MPFQIPLIQQKRFEGFVNVPCVFGSAFGSAVNQERREPSTIAMTKVLSGLVNSNAKKRFPCVTANSFSFFFLQKINTMSEIPRGDILHKKHQQGAFQQISGS